MCRCPACGKGPLFTGFLTVRERCAVCDTPLGAHEQGDAPAVFVILILGFVVVGAALAVEVKFGPPLWVHAILWPPLILGGALALLRPLKGALVGAHYRHRREESERG